jgi:hypothetical protein
MVIRSVFRGLLFLMTLLIALSASAAPGLIPTAFDYRHITYSQIEEYGGATVLAGSVSYSVTGATSGAFIESISNSAGSVSQDSFAPDTNTNYGPVFLHGTGSAQAGPVDIDNPVINRMESIYEISFMPTETFNATLSGTLGSSMYVTTDLELFERFVTVKLYADNPVYGSLIWSFEAPLNTYGILGDFLYSDTFIANQQYALVVETSAWSNQYGEESSGDWDFTLALDIPEVEIDVLPGDALNKVYPNKAGKLPVAVLSSAEFDATQIDPATLKFGLGEAAVADSVTISNVDGEYGADTTARFKVAESGIFCNDTEVALSGETYAGEAFTGIGTIDATECETGGCHPY